LLGDDGAAVPFLRYRPERLSPLGARVEAVLRAQFAEAPSFVAFEGYDTVITLADLLRSEGPHRARMAGSWPHVAVEGTRGQFQFSRMPGISVWQWAWAPAQIADRDPEKPDRFPGPPSHLRRQVAHQKLSAIALPPDMSSNRTMTP
jgi:hypothetical protein